MKISYLAIGAVVILVIIYLVSFNKTSTDTVRSVNLGNEYQSTTTIDWGNAGTFDKQICTTPGTLAQVTVTVSAATKLRLLDANSRSTGGTATTTLAAFVASPTVGTYIFDSVFFRGLYAIVDGGGASLASTTITYRCS